MVRPPALLIDLSRSVRHASDWLQSRPRVVRTFGVLSLAAGSALGIYTGILLSSLGARPLWASGILGPLFLVSGLSTAAAFTHLVARDRNEMTRMKSRTPANASSVMPVRPWTSKMDDGFMRVSVS